MKDISKFLLILLFLPGCYSSCHKRHSKIKYHKEINTSCKLTSINYYINGMNTKRNLARNQNHILSTRLNKEINLLHNYSYGFLKDLIQAYKQKNNEILEDSKRLLLKYLNAKEEDIYTEEELKEIYKAINESKNNILNIIAYSQGNFFANHICKKSKYTNNVMHVASPSSLKTPCKKITFNLSSDEMLKLMKKGKFKIDDANVYDGDSKIDIKNISFKNHSFENYLSKPLFINTAKSFLNKNETNNHNNKLSIKTKNFFKTTKLRAYPSSKYNLSCEDMINAGEVIYHAPFKNKRDSTIVNIGRFTGHLETPYRDGLTLSLKPNKRGVYILKHDDDIETKLILKNIAESAIKDVYNSFNIFSKDAL